MIYYLAGLWLVAWLPALEYVPPILLAAVTLAGVRRLRLPLLWFCFGCVLATGWGAQALSHRLPEALAREEVQIEGVVDDLVQTEAGRQRFTLRIGEAPAGAHWSQLRRVRLNLYQGEPALRGGDRVRLTARLFPPRGLINPAAFDAERRNLLESIDARGYVRELVLLQSAQGRLQATRQQLRDRLQQTFSAQVAATLAALVLGDRSLLDTEQWRLASETATAHLLVVSGLHVAVIAGAGLLIGRVLMPLLVLLGWSANSARRVTLLLAFLLAAGYALIAGLGLPLQRALIMLAVFLFADWRLYTISAWQRWRYALWGVTLLQPLAVMEVGAWLSFGAVALLIWIAQQQYSGCSALALLARVQGQLFVGMLPLSVVLFNQLGLLAPLVNLLAVPLISLLVTLLPLLLPLTLWGDGALAITAAGALDWSLNQYWSGLWWMRAELGLYLPLAAPALLPLLLALCASVLWLMPLPLRWRALALLLVLPLLIPRDGLPPTGSFRATVFDVGQGLAVLIETADGRVLYDTGPGYRQGGSAYPYAIRPLLRQHNISALQEVIISHDDIDHSGGLAALQAEYRTERLRAGQPERMAQPADGCQGEKVLGGVRFHYLSLGSRADSDNDRSCVLLVSGNHCSLLLPGDLTREGERRLLVQTGLDPRQLPSGRLDWLLAGHHGSDGSTSLTWLSVLKPQTVIVSRGAYNAFGHPAAALVERVAQAEARFYDTVSDGALTLYSSAAGCLTESQRQQKRRYWTAGY